MDQVEVSLFGPGFGECAVIHVGNGEWLVIDSCYAPDKRTPAAIEYFNLLKIDPATSVSHVIITHADNDHIGGATELVQQCRSARIVQSMALTNREVLAWIAFNSDIDPSELARSSTELADILELMPNRQHPEIVFAAQDRSIAETDFYKLTSLSPSDARLRQFVGAITAQHPKMGSERRRIPEITPNQASVAMLLETSAVNLILGADLEETPGRAWSHILENSIAYRKGGRAILIKVPHHGSSNADCPELWQGLSPSPIAILATFNKLAEPLPTVTDVKRILGRTEHAYSCCHVNPPNPSRDGEVDKFLRLMDVKRRRRFPSHGQVRVRFRVNAEPTIELFGDAAHLSQVRPAAA